MTTGAALPSSIIDNVIIGKETQPEYSIKGIQLKEQAIREYAEELFEKFDMRGSGVDIEVGSLSGGNMQKVVIAREFSYDANVMIVAQPTRGVDVGAIEFIHNRVIEKRNEGAAVLLVSADLDEVFRLSDRIITIYEGEVTGEFKAGEISKMDISYYMTGHRDREEANA